MNLRTSFQNAAATALDRNPPREAGPTVLTLSFPGLPLMTDPRGESRAPFGTFRSIEAVGLPVLPGEESSNRLGLVEAANIRQRKTTVRPLPYAELPEKDTAFILHSVRRCIESMLEASQVKLEDLNQYLGVVVIDNARAHAARDHLSNLIATEVGFPDQYNPHGFHRIGGEGLTRSLFRVSYQVFGWKKNLGPKRDE